jgi:hypothetical protein
MYRNNGLSAGTAVKSLSVAQGLSADGDTIYVIDSYLAKLDAFNTTTNSFALLDVSPAIAVASTSFLTSLVPSVTTYQLGKIVLGQLVL